ncbi:MAG: hypothetical protein M3R55_02475 [Acidobacteriota bacterium]|nr:hypothetical protein [Acidobacteriota bacterium]
MGDAGEGLVDAEARLQELRDEREASRKSARGTGPTVDPEKVREQNSLKLARTELERQSAATSHPIRQKQIQAAIAEVDKRLKKLG